MPLEFRSGDTMTIQKLIGSVLHHMTGEEMQDLPQYLMVEGMKVYCTQDSADQTFKAGKTYSMTNDLSGFELEGLTSHLHTGTEDGGYLSSTLIANIPTTIDYDKRFVRLASLYTETANGGAVSEDTTNTRMQLSTSSTNTGRASIYDGGARKLNFAYDSSFESSMRLDSTTNYKVKVGINAEKIEASNNALKCSYGIEGCSSTGTTWLVWSADGSNRSTLTTAATVSPVNVTVYNLIHTVANSITLNIDGAFVVEKAMDVPVSGFADLNNLYRAGVQNSTTATKILYHYGGAKIVGMT